MRSLRFLVVVLASVLQLVSAQGSNTITIPPGGFEVTAGLDFTIEWTNPSPRTVTIQLVPASGAGNIVTLGSVLPNRGSAILSIPADVPTTQQYKFKITDDTNSSNVNLSPAFNVAPPPPGYSPTSSSAASTAASTTASSVRVTVTPTSPATPTSSSPAAASTTSPPLTSSTSSLSPGVYAGIAIGAVIVVLVLVGLAVFIFRRRSKHKKWKAEQEQQQPPFASPMAGAPPYEMHDPYAPKLASPTLQGVGVFPQKGADQWSARPEGRRQPSEVSGDRSFPREMEGTSRFPQNDVVELEAREVGSGSRWP